jgi:hypothetical protein
MMMKKKVVVLGVVLLAALNVNFAEAENLTGKLAGNARLYAPFGQ